MIATPGSTRDRSCLTYADARAASNRIGLEVYGGFHPGSGDSAPKDGRTVLMLGPAEPGFWDLFAAQPEFRDGLTNPLDRWSKRVIDGLALELGADACYPFGGPPWHPFFSWALRTGRCWQSPVQLLVHDTAGLFVSFRGALVFRSRVDLPEVSVDRPCNTCGDRPCENACPVGALDIHRYNSDHCKTHVAGPEGGECLDRGCLVRRSCPVSANHGRSFAQSRFHQLAFIGRSE